MTKVRTPSEQARHMARYSHKDWIVWKGKDGNMRAAAVTYASMKQAMLDMGTKGRWVEYSASTVTPYSVTWRQAVIRLMWLCPKRRLFVEAPAQRKAGSDV